jgi:signal transduction histidine kinase
MTDGRIVELLAALARDSEKRRDTACELARYLGADNLLILIRDGDHSVYLPACGFPQTLRGGSSWKAFAAEVAANSKAAAELSYPAAQNKRTARGWRAPDGTLLILFDGEPILDRVQMAVGVLPLITPGFDKERTTMESAAQARLSAQAAEQARGLAESLDAVRRQLQATAILREQDIAERKRIEAELENSNSNLKRVNDDLNQFTFAATHDVREPLRMITIYVQLLQKEFGGHLTGDARMYIDRVVDGSQRIARLMDGLLQFTRIGEMQSVRITPVCSQAALQEALADLQIPVNESQAHIVQDELPQVMADHLHLRQVFQNLIGNAIKYRRPGVPLEIRITAGRQGEQWLFAVEDNGIGIAPQHHDQVFVPFKRLHGSEISGAGIGLATCRRIVERYGGRICVQSEEHRGSVFYFSLPAVEGFRKV